MDFGSLIHKAQQNGQSSKKEVRYYSTKFEPPKKEERSKRLSANIQKFLARKEDEEKKRADVANKRRNQLLELRSKDKKAVKRVNVMLKRTKSANQSVIQDADSDNTALAGSSQPDEDDYGYVSQSASEYYNKMMEKYSKMPDEPKFLATKKKVSTNLSSTKDRVKAALERESENALHPQRKKRKSKEPSSHNEESLECKENSDEEKEFKTKPTKPKLKPAPVINFSDLLKIAEKKQYEPIIIEQKAKEEERLFTKKQKRELEKEREYKERREQMKQQKISTPLSNKSLKIDGDNTNNHRDISSKNINDIKRNNMKQDNKMPRKDINRVDCKIVEEKSKMRNEKIKNDNSQSNTSMEKSTLTDHSGNKFRLDKSQNEGKNRVIGKGPKEKKDYGYPKDILYNTLKAKQLIPTQSKPKQFIPKDINVRQFPPSDVRKSLKSKLPVNKGRILDDDDEEYDSEMDDFIDDQQEEGENYSKHISEIFGYDKNKYRYVDEDDDNMESSFAQQMREEVISSKIGIMEDLEDIKMEEEAKKKKAILKKKYK